MERRFGVNLKELQGLEMREISGDVWLCSEDRINTETETRGIRAVRCMDIGLKPTTYILQLLQDEISRNVVEVSLKEFEKLLSGGMIQREMEEKGYVVISYQDKYYGCGFYMDELVSSRIPEGRAKELVDMI